MPEINSAFATCLRPGDYGVADNAIPALTLCERPLGTLSQISGWTSFEKSCRPALTTFGFKKTGNYRTVQMVDKAECYAISPEKILLRHPGKDTFDRLKSKVDPAVLAAVDLSHARCVIAISGDACEMLMARLSGIDFSLSEFPVGNFVQTGIHHVGVMIKRDGTNSFELFIPTTWAASLWDYLCTCATSFGYRVEGSGT